MGWEGIDKRKFPRVRLHCRISLFREGKKKEIESYTENIGLGGVCVAVSTPMDVFEQLIIDIFMPGDEEIITCRGEVVWVVRRRPADHSCSIKYDTGIQFKDISKKDEALLQEIISCHCAK